VQVAALVGGQAEGSGDRVQDLGRDVVPVALLQPGVVGDADAGELGEFLAA
jgi:hypothetical protein